MPSSDRSARSRSTWPSPAASASASRLITDTGWKSDDDFVHVLDPEALASARVEDLRALQLTNAKARAVVATARAATAGELLIDDLERDGR